MSNDIIQYNIFDDNAEWDFSESHSFMVIWRDEGNDDLKDLKSWYEQDFNIEIPLQPIKDLLHGKETIIKIEVKGGYVLLNREDAEEIMEGFYENHENEADLN